MMNLLSRPSSALAAFWLAVAFGAAPAQASSRDALRQIKTVFVIALENHNWTQPCPECAPQQIFHNPAAPYVNSLVTAGDPNAAQVSYAAKYYSAGFQVHPSETNYIWAEAGTTFGVYTDRDPSAAAGNLFTCQHLTGQMTAAGIAWKSYQEDLEYTTSAAISVKRTGGAVNPYNGSTEINYAVKHNPMEFFTDTQNKNVFPLAQFWTDLSNGATGRYNWVTMNQFNEMHSALANGFTSHGVHYTGNQAAIAEGDHCLSIIIPKIMASQAYQDHGVIIIWTDETERGDSTDNTLPEIVISPLAKGNAYASQVVYSHSSDLKTMDEIFGLAFQTNPIPVRDHNASDTGYNTVAGAYDLSDMFRDPSSNPAAAAPR